MYLFIRRFAKICKSVGGKQIATNAMSKLGIYFNAIDKKQKKASVLLKVGCIFAFQVCYSTSHRELSKEIN